MPRVALTCDDAPSIAGDRGGVRADPQRMDRVRETLTAAGVEHCVAFVIGGQAVGHESALARWLDAGFELGNHTHRHMAASRMSEDEFLRDVLECHAILERVGAFDGGRVRWLRVPYLDRGSSSSARRRLAARIADLGYRAAPVSVDCCDYRFEEPLADAEDPADVARIGERYDAVARASLASAVTRLGEATPAIAACHFGEVSARFLGQLLLELGENEVEWCALEDAVDTAAYVSFAEDFERNGLVTGDLPRTLGEKLARRAARWSERLDLFEQTRFGPRWPHL